MQAHDVLVRRPCLRSDSELRPLRWVLPMSAEAMNHVADLDPGPPRAYRRKLPAERDSITHKFVISACDPDGGELVDHEVYLTVGMYDDGTPGEIFLRPARVATELWRGLLDDFAVAVSMALQYGVPLRAICSKFVGIRYEPSGHTNNRAIPRCTSPTDYVARWLLAHFAPPEE